MTPYARVSAVGEAAGRARVARDREVGRMRMGRDRNDVLVQMKKQMVMDAEIRMERQERGLMLHRLLLLSLGWRALGRGGKKQEGSQGE